MKYYADRVNLHARIYAMRARILTLRDYTSIVRDKQALCETVCDMGNTIETSEIVFKEQIRDIIKLAEATGLYTGLFIAFLRQYEALNVKLILSKAFNRPVLEQWYDIGPYAVVDRSLAMERLSVDDVKTVLGHTYLKEIFDDISSFERIEMRLDILTARNFYDSSSQFRPDQRRVFQEFILKRAAVTGLIQNWRLKESYQWSDEKIHHYLEMIHGIFDSSPGRQLKTVGKILSNRIEQLRKSSTKTPEAADIEYYLEQYFYNWILSMFHKDFHSVYCVVAYLWLLAYQIRNMFRIIDGMRFGLPPEAIIERIVCEV